LCIQKKEYHYITSLKVKNNKFLAERVSVSFPSTEKAVMTALRGSKKALIIFVGINQGSITD
jgi:hypothetical protein